MRKYIALFLLLIPFVADAGLLTGQTAGSYSIPSGWTLVRAEGFEGTKPAGDYWGRFQGSKTTEGAHTGTYGISGMYSAGQHDIGWEIGSTAVGSFNEIYLSYWEYTDAAARFSDEYIWAEFGLDGVNQRIFVDWVWAGNASGTMGYNGTYAVLAIMNEQGPPDYTPYIAYKQVPVGSWVQWEIHLRPASAASVSDGFIRIYKDGTLYASKENHSFNYRFGKTGSFYAVAGGQYNRLTWMTDYPTCTACANPGVGTDACTGEMNWWYLPLASPQCGPATTPFTKRFDDVILMKLPGGPDGTDTQPPYITGQSPAAGATGVPITQTTISFNIKDDRTDDDGITLGTINLNVEGVNYTCTTGLTCSGSASNYLVSRTNVSNWSDAQVVNMIATATDAAGNVMNQSWSFTAATTPGSLNITTTTLPNGKVGDSYSQTLASTGGTTPITWSMDTTPYNPGYPYTPSTTISGVTWDFANVVTTGTGSDLWHTTWAGDNNVYMAWGDGGGPDGNNTMCRTHFGLVKANGTPPNFTWTEIWGCKADGTGCEDWGELTHSASCDTPYGGTLSDYGVPDVLFSIDNTLYVITTASGLTSMKLSSSTNFGQSWTTAAWTWTTTGTGFQPSGIASFGMGYAGARDSYVYLYGGKNGNYKNIYLARCPKTELMTQGSWEYFTGTAASPTWGTWANATSIHYDASRIGESGSSIYDYVASKVQYFSAIDRYIMTVNGGQIQQLRIYDAPEPWGPWTTVYYNDSWGGYGVTNGLYYNVMPKFTSTDGKTFWMTFSGYNAPVNYDNYYVIKGTFTLSTSGTNVLPNGLSLSSTGVISGIPTPPPATGQSPVTTSFTVTATDSASTPQTDNQALSITVYPTTPGGTVTVTGTAFEDTFLNSADGTTNYSDVITLGTYDWPDYTVANKILLMDNTDILALPADNILITAATLRLYMIEGGGYNPTKIKCQWINGGTLPAISTVAWDNYAGTSISPLDSDILGVDASVSLTPGWVEWNVLTAAQWAHANQEPLYLVLFDGTGTADTWRDFASTEHSTASWTPQLVISYMPQAGGAGISAPGKFRVSKMKGTFK